MSLSVNSYKNKVKVNNVQSFTGIVRPKKFFQTPGNLNNKFNVLWIDTKRNYSVLDFNNNGKIKNSLLLKNKLVKNVFDFFELKLKNVHKVSPNYYRGSVLSCKYDVDRLKTKGVTDIISLLEPQKARPDIAEYAKNIKLQYHNFHLSQDGLPTEEQIHKFLAVCKNAKGAVYVHCLHGKDRTGIMTFLYEVELLKVKPIDAFNHMVSKGIHLQKNIKMLDVLKQRYPELKNEKLVF